MDRTRTIQIHSGRIIELIKNARILVRRIDEGIDHTPIDLVAVVETSLESVQSRSEATVLEVDAPASVEVLADDLLSAVVDNLVSNAIDHNDSEEPTVRVSVDTVDDVAVLRVADDGPGIPADQREAVFEPGDHGDHGLGLYLVRTLVTDYGGEVHVEANEPRGTVVVVTLPLADGCPATPSATDDTPLSTRSV